MTINISSVMSWLSTLGPETVYGTIAVVAAVISLAGVGLWYWLKIR
jgi:hypothetical protein